MEYRKVGNSGLKVSAVGLGGLNFGTRLDEAQSIRVISHALDLGVNYLDTAASYGMGKSEEIIGKAIKGKRSSVHITTKVGANSMKTPDRQSGSRPNIMQWVDIQLNRLDTDYIDLYVLHHPDPDTPIQETLRAMDDLVRAGKVRYIGCGGFTACQLSEALWTSRTHNLESFIVAGNEYNLIDRRIEQEFAPYCQANGVAVICSRPLASGFLTGKYGRGLPQSAVPSSTHDLAGSAAPGKDHSRDYAGHLTDANFDRLGKFEAFARERAHNVTELALAWMLSRSWIATVIPGAMTAEQVTQNVSAGDWKLSKDDIAELDTITI